MKLIKTKFIYFLIISMLTITSVAGAGTGFLRNISQHISPARLNNSLLNLGMVGIFTIMMSCSLPNTLVQQGVESSVNADLSIDLEYFGEGQQQVLGITQEWVETYEAKKHLLSPRFYDGMMVHYIVDGIDFVQTLDLANDGHLRVRSKEYSERKPVDHKTIEGILVGKHSDYNGLNFFSFTIENARPLDENGRRLLELIPAEAVLYGQPGAILTGDNYLMQAAVVSFGQDEHSYLPALIRFIVDRDKLTSIDPEEEGLIVYRQNK